MRILVTGSTGFLGKHLLKLFIGHDIYTTEGVDLRDSAQINKAIDKAKPDVIFHLAADVGGIKYNLSFPAGIFHDNVMMNTQLITHSAQRGIRRFIFVSSVCAYPLKAPIPTKEDSLFKGEIEYSNRSYGLSKLIALQQLRACKVQYNMDFSYPILANLYGPGDGGFLHTRKSHLIPNLIREFCSQPPEIEMWGDGSLTRDMLYVEDAADALLKLLHIDYDEPLNIATGTEVSIRQIAENLTHLTDYPGQVNWADQPDKGEPRRCYDTTMAKNILDWQAETGIEEGLRQTVEWYKKQFK